MLRVACGVQSGRQVGFNYPETAFPIETDHFSGRMYFRLRYLEGEPTEYFRGRTRKLSCVVQGRFKHALPMSECFTGYEFERPMDNVPAHWLISTILRAVKKLAPTVMIDVLGPKPYILNPLFQTIQLLHVAHPGEEPPLTAYPLREQTALLGGVFAQKPFDRLQRKNYFASTRNGEKHTLQPGLVYTMEFYEDKMDFSTFEFAVIGMRFGLARFLAGQPLQIMGKVGNVPHSTDYIFNVELWHESLLRDAKDCSGSGTSTRASSASAVAAAVAAAAGDTAGGAGAQHGDGAQHVAGAVAAG